MRSRLFASLLLSLPLLAYSNPTPLPDVDQLIASAENHLYGQASNPDYAKAFALYEQAAQLGSPKAALRLAALLRAGQGAPKDAPRAFELTLKAAQDGYVPAQASLGTLYQKGIGTEVDAQKALEWLRKAADAGNVSAMALVSDALGEDVAGQQYLQNAKTKASANEAYAIAYGYLKGARFEKNPDKAIEWGKLASEKGEPRGLYEVAQGFMDKKDWPQAALWFEKSADAGNTEAALKAARLYRDGAEGLASDANKAAHYLKRSAHLGDAHDQWSGLLLLQSGPGQERDLATAQKLFEQWLSKADALELEALSERYWYGQGVRKNFALGGALGLAALQKGGDNNVCSFAAKLAHRGWLGSDVVVAYSLLNRCALDNPEDLQIRHQFESLEKSMSAKEIHQAQSLEPAEALAKLKAQKPSIDLPQDKN